MTAAHWYYIRDGKEHGPVLPHGLKAMADFGSLKPSDLVRGDGMERWVPANRLSGLFSPECLRIANESTAAGDTAADLVRGPLIEFLPAADEGGQPAMPPKKFQFSIMQMLIAACLVATSFAIAARLLWHAATWHDMGIGTALGVLALFGCAAAGVLTNRRMPWTYYGVVAGLALAAGGLVTLALILPVLIVARGASGPARDRDPKIVAARLQRSIYKLSAICSISLVFIWVPIVFLIGPNRACRPMAQTLVTVLFVAPTMIVAVARAVRQIIDIWPEKRGLLAIAIALLPIAVFVFTQWLILSACGITYED